MSRYTTPPDETPEERKKRLKRKRQTECYHRRRATGTVSPAPTAASTGMVGSHSVTLGDVAPAACNSTPTLLPPPPPQLNVPVPSPSSHREASNIEAASVPTSSLPPPPAPQPLVPSSSSSFHAQDTSSTPAWMSRYTTPPDETPDERKNRLRRKRQTECYHRRRATGTVSPAPTAASTRSVGSHSVAVGVVEPTNGIPVSTLLPPPPPPNPPIPSSSSHHEARNIEAASNPVLSLPLLPAPQPPVPSSSSSSSLHAQDTSSTPAWMSRYTTPPDETPDERKNRLRRKRQTECYHRRRATGTISPAPTAASTRSVGSHSVAVGVVEPTNGIPVSTLLPPPPPPNPPIPSSSSHHEARNIEAESNPALSLPPLPAPQPPVPTSSSSSVYHAQETTSTPAWMARYATPPDETSDDKKKRLKRKRNAESYHRRRAAGTVQPAPTAASTGTVSSHDVHVGAVEPVTSNPTLIFLPPLPPPPNPPAPSLSSSHHEVRNDESSSTSVHVPACHLPIRQRWEAILRDRLQQRNRSGRLKVALGDLDSYNRPERHRLSAFEPCPFCTALKWPGETGRICCNGGQVLLPSFREPPRELLELFDDDAFMRNIRGYNNAFAFTSMGASMRPADRVRQDQEVAGQFGVYNYRIQGALCHRIGTLGHRAEQAPRYAQLYFYDSNSVEHSDRMVDARLAYTPNLDRAIVQRIQNILQGCNPLAAQFRHAFERICGSENLMLRIHARLPGLDQRRYNQPTVDEVAGIFLCSEQGNPRDVVLQDRDTGYLNRVYESHQLFDAMQYPLLHPHGEVGWTFGMPKQPRRDVSAARRPQRDGHNADDGDQDAENREAIRASARQISPREYAAYRLCFRREDMSLIHRGGRLMQQYCVDQCCKIEEQRLKFQRENQAQLRADAYGGLMDLAGPVTVQPGQEPRTLDQMGTRIILSPTFPGGDRYMRAQYQDAMAIVRAIGKPDLFITVTCNPNWPEITGTLLPRQKAADRPDLTARVFRLKLKSLLEDLSAGVLGLEIARIHVIEYQKRGLPHAHCLVILAEADKPRSAADYDRLVSAEIPDPANEELHETICKSMMHGPCGSWNPAAPCMKDGVCSKRFPKPFCDETRQTEDGYPMYRRRNDGRTVVVKNVALDNRHVVPYNPWLSHKYNCHINVEVCATISSVKYLYKYVYKGHDRVAVSTTEPVDEIQQYVDARYISASQAVSTIFGFEVQAKTVTVVQLPIHLENRQSVVFRDTETVDEVLERGHHTMLTRFFQLAANDSHARRLTYQDIPAYYRYAKPSATQRLSWHDGTGKQWIRRIQQNAIVVGRMVYCPISDMERYCLRLLLCYRNGPTSFEDLRTVSSSVCGSFQEAAARSGLLHDESEWDRSLQEAVSFQMPSQLRHLFALILSEGKPLNPHSLWEAYADHLCEDYHRQHRERYTVDDSEQNRLLRAAEHFWALRSIDQYLRGTTPPKTLETFPSMPQLSQFSHLPAELLQFDRATNANVLIDAERSYSITGLDRTLRNVDRLNAEQRAVYNTITEAVDRSSQTEQTGGRAADEESGSLYFLDGPGGTGKSFLLETILAYTRRQTKIALASASSGIAALLLTGGKTVHSTFKLPLILDENSHCNIPAQSQLADLMRQATLIVWDEASMSSRYALEAVDRTLQDIVGVRRPFGGKVMLLCGDFRQILPIVPRGTDAQVVQHCIKRSPLWHLFRVLRLRVNMRVQTAPNARDADDIQEFADFLLRIGEGRHQTLPGLDATFAKLPRDMMLPRTGNQQSDVLSLIDHVYPDLGRQYQHSGFFTDRAILSPRNVDVTAINNSVLEGLTEPEEVYLSVDTLVNSEEQDTLMLPTEFLNSLNMSGIPVHRLRLKRYTPVLLLRNLNTERGLCNGTRLQIVSLRPHCLHARILTGKRQGEDVLLPRIFCDSNDATLPFQIRRKQFPVQVCFAMTINKAQVFSPKQI
ncbi:uncharacterized protein LOC131285143 [Anopheles ziemanni]|uniref:uncharacterized protein LOC131264096 n=1 Tax=Anopheles coustani TaxID=139045 RepID=UPI0026591386|nr:uncharacterized protein LOC131264096 [Anopheles coustani]XP_058169986.1 uncharacterized protein LOC131285143 [Anopheles ziemanni]